MSAACGFSTRSTVLPSGTAAPPAAIALAWLIARPSVTAPIASATSVDQLKSLAAAVRLTLTADDIRELDAASA
jgi:aryl-alcohol dehydrogenase-like predicted oxidoreductase